MNQAQAWYEEQQSTGFPALMTGDLFLSMYHGNLLSAAVAYFQKVGSHWSHGGVYIWGGMTSEATSPKGGLHKLRDKMTSRYTLAIYRIVGIDRDQRYAIAAEACRIDHRPYDNWHLFRALVDNFFERLTWNGQTGWKPMSWFFKASSDDKNFCTELVERAVYKATGEKMQGGDLGDARPTDMLDYCKRRCDLVFFHDKGKVQPSVPPPLLKMVVRR